MKIPIASILIGERQRIDLGDPLNDLASIGDAEVGLINPITVEEGNFVTSVQQYDNINNGYRYKLIAGRRRLEWHIRSGKTEIEATVRGQMSELAKQKMELLEDIERKDRTWQEEALAWTKLYNLIRMEKQAENLSWTVRAMARFTGLPKTTVNYAIEIAGYLKAEPRDDEMWNTRNFTDAIKLVVDRNYKLANDELEKRRQLWQQREAEARRVVENIVANSSPVDYITEESPTPEFVSALGDVPNTDTTPPRTKVFIHGLNMAFEDAVPGVHFMTGMTKVVLGWMEQPIYDNLNHALHPDGLAILWMNREIAIAPNLVPGPFLIWNRIATTELHTNWPFVRNFYSADVWSKTEPTTKHPNPSGSVISCLPEGDDLPYPVVEWCLRAICPDNTAVLCPCNAPVLAIAMTGRTPIWFEADKAKFDAKVASLKEYYLDNIPNCDVYLRKVDATGDWTSEAI